MLKGILLLGPTGVGKSPLGDLLEKTGLYGHKCLHFDFGRELRTIAKGAYRHDILPSERIFIKKVLEEGLLLENEHFYLAEKILSVFLKARVYSGREILIMNGLPRHEGQAKALARKISIRLVVRIEASFEEILERIHRNTGGDRKGRDDDYIELIYRKWQIYKDRTRPLIEFYQKNGAKILKFLVGRFTTPQETLTLIQEKISVNEIKELF